MKKMRKFCYEWNIGKREIMTFIGMIFTLGIVYMVLVLTSFMCQ